MAKVAFAGSGRAEEMHHLGAVDEPGPRQRHDAVAVEGGLEGAVEALQRLGGDQRGGLEGDADAAVLACDVLLMEQPVAGVDRQDLAPLEATEGVVEHLQRPRHAQADEAVADAVGRGARHPAPPAARRRPTAS